MTHQEAKELLLLHSFSHPSSAEDPRAASGFLGSLRPFSGSLNPANLHEVMAALETLAPDLTGPSLDREIISALWGITHLARAWGVEPGGMLRRNNLISEDDVSTLSTWVETISYATFMLLDGAGIDVAFHDYREMVRSPRPVE